MGSATAEDLFASLSTAAGKDIAPAFRSFIEQPGVPLVATTLACDGAPRVVVEQSRYFPAGSAGDKDKRWQIPLCVRYGADGSDQQTCTLVAEPRAEIALEGAVCPTWYLPNAGGAAYAKLAMSAEDLGRLLVGVPVVQAQKVAKKNPAPVKPPLSAVERAAAADAVRTGFARGTLSTAEVLTLVGALAQDDARVVGIAGIDVLQFLHDEVASERDRPIVATHARALYRPALDRIGFDAKKSDDSDRRLYREKLLDFLARMNDGDVRKRLAALGRRYVGADSIVAGKGLVLDKAAVDPDLAVVALSIAVQDGEDPLFAGLAERLKTETDPLLRNHILAALTSTTDSDHAQRTRALAFDANALKASETDALVLAAFKERANRTAAWDHYAPALDRLLARTPTTRQSNLVWMGAFFCSGDRADEVNAAFSGSIEEIPGGPRNLASTLEIIRLCDARAGLHRDGLKAALQKM
jgi:alanyl aminopeptidase